MVCYGADSVCNQDVIISEPLHILLCVFDHCITCLCGSIGFCGWNGNEQGRKGY